MSTSMGSDRSSHRKLRTPKISMTCRSPAENSSASFWSRSIWVVIAMIGNPSDGSGWPGAWSYRLWSMVSGRFSSERCLVMTVRPVGHGRSAVAGAGAASGAGVGATGTGAAGAGGGGVNTGAGAGGAIAAGRRAAPSTAARVASRAWAMPGVE
jgi:hypothetical protein